MKKKSKLKTALSVIFAIIVILALIVVPCKVATTVSDGLSLSSHLKDAPLLVAHRGFSSVRPENTHSAFYAAAEAGFDGYEFDLHTTKDGKWVVIHDDTVDKMTDGTGNVEDFTFEEIRKLKVDGGNGNEDFEYLAEKPTVPSLGEALSYAEEYDIIPVIEIKKCDMKYLSDLKAYLDERGLSERAVIISFTREYLEAYRALDKDIQIYWLSTDFTKEDVDWCTENNFGINFHHMLLYRYADAVLYAGKQGVKLAAWTVDNTVYKDIMVLFGVDVITTNKITPLSE
ncbi:MAG: hypothetical protein E7543_06565 [Ruminococcaceae bacterium]|nr:hypothetical protein [Oscillospiraceae bacterium]